MVTNIITPNDIHLFNPHAGEGVVKVRSKYDNYYKDRVWDWGCGQVTKDPLGDCSWSSDLNHWIQDLTFMCPRNKFITGETYCAVKQLHGEEI